MLIHKAIKKLEESFWVVNICEVIKSLVHIDREGHLQRISEIRVVKIDGENVVISFCKGWFSGLERLRIVSELLIICDT